MGWARLYSLFDWFVPPELRGDKDPHRRARMLVIAHVLGPPLGFPIVAYLAWLRGATDRRDDRVLLALSRSLAFYPPVHPPCPSLGSAFELGGSFYRISLRRCRFAIPRVDARRSGRGILLPGAANPA